MVKAVAALKTIEVIVIVVVIVVKIKVAVIVKPIAKLINTL